MRRFLEFRAHAKRSGRSSAGPNGGGFPPTPAATPFRISRNRPFRVFLTAVIAANAAVMTVGLKMSFFYRALEERGQTAVAEVTRHEARPAIRASDNHFYFYTYQTAAGTTHQGNTAMHALNVGDTVTVTYLPETSEDHVLFQMTPNRINQPIRASCTFFAASLSVTLFVGAFVHWALRGREK